MKLIINSFIFLFYILVFSQEKPIYYYNINGKSISKELYEENMSIKENDRFLYDSHYVENDTCFVAKLYKKISRGRLTNKQFVNLKNHLNNISSTPLNDSTYYIIHYNQKEDSCGNFELKDPEYSIFSKGYLKKLNRIFNYKMFWVYKSDENLSKAIKRKVDWKFDEDLFLEKLFLKDQFLCGSLILVSPKGNYITCRTEYAKLAVLIFAKELKNK